MANLRIVCVVLFAIVAWLLVSSPVTAQRLAVTYSMFPTVPTVIGVVNLGAGTVESLEQQAVFGPGVFSSDGRFLLLFYDHAGTPALELRDLATRTRTAFYSTFVPRRAHPRRLAVYGLDSGVVTRLDPTGFRRYAACSGTLAIGLELALAGSRLIVQCGSGVIESLDEATSARVSAFVASNFLTFSMAINASGSRAVVARRNTPSLSELVLFDAESGVELLAVELPGGPPPAPFTGPGAGSIVAATPSRDAVIVTSFWSFDPGPGAPRIYYRRTHLVDFDTLATRTQLDVPYDPHSVSISPDGHRAFVASNDFNPGASIQEFDLRTGQTTAQANIVNGFASVGGAFPPLPPTVPPATVNGQRVTISWSLPANSPPADRFVIHAGSRSGASDLGTLEFGPGVTSFTANGVPAGRYFIRMTAVNFTGTSAPSNELIVDVP